MNKIPIICESLRHWRAYRNKYLNDFSYVKYRYTVVKGDDEYFPVLINDKYMLMGLKLKKAIIYCCHPKIDFMEVLYSRFRESKPIIEEIWD